MATRSEAGSTPQSAKAIRRAAVVTHGRRDAIGPALTRLERLAEQAGVELLLPPDELEKHGIDDGAADLAQADIAVVLGGDGTMLRALHRLIGTGVPVIGVNFGSVGFLTSMPASKLEEGLARVFAGDYRVIELPTLDAVVHGERSVAVNDVVATGSRLGKMVEIAWSVGGEELGSVPCDGLICATPAGSTAYNLSNGGPVLVWGLDAHVVTFIAPHSLHARPLVVPRGLEVVATNLTYDVPVTVLVDGTAVGELGRGEHVEVRLGEERSLLATLPEATFFTRYRETFAS